MNQMSYHISYRMKGRVMLIHKVTGATLYVTMVTVTTTFSLYFGQDNRIFLATRSVLSPKISKICRNAIAAGAPARTSLRELATLPQTP